MFSINRIDSVYENSFSLSPRIFTWWLKHVWGLTVRFAAVNKLIQCMTKPKVPLPIQQITATNGRNIISYDKQVKHACCFTKNTSEIKYRYRSIFSWTYCRFSMPALVSNQCYITDLITVTWKRLCFILLVYVGTFHDDCVVCIYYHTHLFSTVFNFLRFRLHSYP